MENPTLDPPRGGMEHPGRKKNEKGRSRAHFGEVVFRTFSTLDSFVLAPGDFLQFFQGPGSGLFFCGFGMIFQQKVCHPGVR